LYCLEQAIKRRPRNLKLAAVRPLGGDHELMRVDRLFEVFATSDEAVRSFQLVAPAASLQTRLGTPQHMGLRI